MTDQKSPSTFNWGLLGALFLTFLRIGPVTFGGGYAIIPLLDREVVNRRKWMNTIELADLLAVAGAAPGAMGINASMLIGYRLAGLAGALVALAGVLIPTFSIVLVLVVFFLQLQDHPKVQAAFVSIRATVVALIVYAGYRIGRTALVDLPTWLIAGSTVLILAFTGISPILVIAAGAAVGIAYTMLAQKLSRPSPLPVAETAAAIDVEPQDKNDKKRIEYVYPDYFIGSGI